jgi:hypothetical protein
MPPPPKKKILTNKFSLKISKYIGIDIMGRFWLENKISENQ